MLGGMTLRSRLLLPTALLLTAVLAACGAPSPEATERALEGGSGSGQPGATSEQQPQPGAGAGPLIVEGMPVSGRLHGCDEVVGETVNETEFDTQWRWEFVCTSRDAFDASTAELDADAALTRTQSMVAGDASYISDWHHWIGSFGGGVLDVDLKLTGSPDDLEMVYLVTLGKGE